MFFTHWPSLTSRTGKLYEITWGELVERAKTPEIAEDKKALAGWSPCRFASDRRKKEACEFVSALVLDDDKSALPPERLAEIWGGYSSLVHTSFSHTPEHPRYRIVLQCSRDMTPAEYERVWAWARDRAKSFGQTLDENAKDVSRFWYVPACRAEDQANYGSIEFKGEVLDVDEVLTSYETSVASPVQQSVSVDSDPVGASDPLSAMAAALGAAWPAKGRHGAQLALAGALRGDGWPSDKALDFLCAVCRAAGDEDRPKREETIRHTYAQSGRLTGWTRLKAYVNPVVVDAARGALAPTASVREEFAEVFGGVAATATAKPTTEPQAQDETLGFEFGCWEQEPPRIEFLVDELIPRACVGMFFGRADALKTWLLFSLGLAVASGRMWLGRYKVPKSLKVGIVDFETGKANVDRRLFMLGAGKTKNLGRKSFAKLKPNDPKFWRALAKEGFDLVIVDSLRRANPGANENESGEAILPLELAAEFSEFTKAAVLFIHHAKKDSSDGWPEFRGSGAIEDQVDVSFAVRKTDVTDEKKTVEVRCVKPGDMPTPKPFTVEVTFDDGARTTTLQYVEGTEKKTDADEEDVDVDALNDAKAKSILKANPAGVPKADLLNVLTGREQTRRACISRLALANLTIEYKDSKDNKTVFVMVRPGAEL